MCVGSLKKHRREGVSTALIASIDIGFAGDSGTLLSR
jgi:hypothetical protein